MLVEVVLTPDLFSGDDDTLRERLRDLAEIILPRRSVPIVIVCELGEHNWQMAVAKRIVAIKNRNLQSDAKALFDRFVDSVCVVRRVQYDSIPATESEWIKIATQSAKQAPIDAIVVTSVDAKTDSLVSIADFVCDHFWIPYSNPRLVPRNTPSQLAALRTLALHVDWMIVRLPQLRGGDDDEIVTVNQIPALISQRGKTQTECSVELQVCQQAKIPDDRLLSGIRHSLVCKNALLNVTYKLMPHKAFVDRELLAGQWAPMAGGGREKRARWLVTMSHVAVGSNRENISQPSTLAHFDRKHAADRLIGLSSEPCMHVGKIDCRRP